MVTQPRPILSLDRWFAFSPDVTVRTLWLARRQILMTTVVFIGLGIVTAFLLTPEFRSEARIMPEMSNGSGDMFKRLASVAGFTGMDFTEAEGLDAVRPDLYPNVLQSTPFVLYLINQPVITTNGESITLGNFLLPEDNSWSLRRFFSFDKKPISNPSRQNKPPGLVRLSARQRDLADEISERVSAKLDTRSGIITITAIMPDANVAAFVAHLAMDYLTQYVTNYRTGKARQDLQFYQQRLNDAQRRYQTAQYNVFHYNDQHKYYVVQAATMENRRLEAELSISQSVYTELSRQLEQAKLKVQERTPIFKVLEPAQVPLKRASPKRTLLVLLFAAFGFAVGVAYTLAQNAPVLDRLRRLLHENPHSSPTNDPVNS